MRLLKGLFNFATLLVLFAIWPRSNGALEAGMSVGILVIWHLFEWFWLIASPRRLVVHLIFSMTVLPCLLVLGTVYQDELHSLTLIGPIVLGLKLIFVADAIWCLKAIKESLPKSITLRESK